jgi:hypothetical protein
MQCDIDRQLAGLRHEMRDPVEKLTGDVAAMKSHCDSAIVCLDASHEKPSVAGKRLEHAESVARMDSLAAETVDLKCIIEKCSQPPESPARGRSPGGRFSAATTHRATIAPALVVTASAWQALQDDLAALKREISDKSDHATVNTLFEELKNALGRIEEWGARVEWQHSTTLGASSHSCYPLNQAMRQKQAAAE